ncbi:hypothetical protein [Acidovorax sp. A1169]|uniref:hypothetical protein n=1 Tax=Acidovorax sp. A1169 TaxID=3059524 RepID=UPI002737F5FE|nr:hypothetical protein [Acidovorax sp. A1169]
MEFRPITAGASRGRTGSRRRTNTLVACLRYPAVHIACLMLLTLAHPAHPRRPAARAGLGDDGAVHGSTVDGPLGAAAAGRAAIH